MNIARIIILYWKAIGISKFTNGDAESVLIIIWTPNESPKPAETSTDVLQN